MVRRICWAMFTFTVLILCWEVSFHYTTDMHFILPSPLEILNQMYMNSDRLTFHSLETFKVMIGGIILSLIIAFPTAWLMSNWGTANLILQPLFVISQCIPMFTLAPIMVLWFGWSYTALVVPTALMIFLPLTMNIYHGIKSTPNQFLEYFNVCRASPWQKLFKLQLPWALPSIFSGFRIAAAIAGIGAIAGEWAGAQSGLGILMLESRRGADLEIMFGALACLMILSLSLYAIVALVEYLVYRSKFIYIAQKAVHVSSIILTIACFSGCQSSSDNNEVRLVLDWLPNPNHVPIYVGIEKGYFTENDIHLHVQKAHDASDAIPYLTTSQTELAISYMPSTIQAIENGANIKPIAILIPEPLNALIYRKNSQIHSIKDLNGKIFGYCVDGSGTRSLDLLLKLNNILPKDKRNVCFDLVTTLGKKRVDVVYGAFWNIECEQLRSMGIETEFIKLTDLGYHSYCELIIIAKNDSKYSSSEFTEKFARSLQRSIEYCQMFPEEAFEIYLNANPDKGIKAQNWERKAWQKTVPLFAKTQEIDWVAWKAFAEWLRENNLL
jgi:NitT/TauT family transport system substrate-binding protein